MEVRRRRVQTGALHPAAVTEQRHDGAQAQAPVEIRSADAHAVIRQNVAFAIGLPMAVRTETHDREIRRAAADVGDQRDLLAGNLAFVVQRRRDRLELERHVIEADLADDSAQRLFGLPVGLRRIVDEMHRTAVNDAAELAAGGLLGPALHRAEIERDHVAEAAAFAADQRGLLDQRGAEHGLQAPHQPSRNAVDIGTDGGMPDGRAPIALKKDRAGNRGLFSLQGNQRRRTRHGAAEGRVRRAEIEPAR